MLSLSWWAWQPFDPFLLLPKQAGADGASQCGRDALMMGVVSGDSHLPALQDEVDDDKDDAQPDEDSDEPEHEQVKHREFGPALQNDPLRFRGITATGWMI